MIVRKLCNRDRINKCSNLLVEFIFKFTLWGMFFVRGFALFLFRVFDWANSKLASTFEVLLNLHVFPKQCLRNLPVSVISLAEDSHEVALDFFRNDRVGLVAGVLLDKTANESSSAR